MAETYDRTLHGLLPGQSGIILSVGNPSGAVKRRLIDMGLTPGTEVPVKESRRSETRSKSGYAVMSCLFGKMTPHRSSSAMLHQILAAYLVSLLVYQIGLLLSL